MATEGREAGSFLQHREPAQTFSPPHAGGRLFEPWEWTRVLAANPDYPAAPLEDVAYCWRSGSFTAALFALGRFLIGRS